MSKLETIDAPQTLDLSIVIVNWNTKKLLRKCLETTLTAMQRVPSMDGEIVVVDNASTDGSAEMLIEQFPTVETISSATNHGFARANNIAIRRSRGRYIVLLNPDTEVKPDTLQILMDYMENNAHVGAAGPLVLNPDDSLQTSCYPFPTLSREFWRLFHLDTIRQYGVYRMEEWDTSEQRVVDVLLGACIVVRRSVLEEIGLLDERYFMYTEEVDLCYRIQSAGWDLCWVPQAQIVHYGGQSTQQIAAEMFLHLYSSKLAFIRKYYGRFAGILYKFILFATAVVRIVLSLLVGIIRSSNRRQHRVLAGYYRQLVVALPSM